VLSGRTLAPRNSETQAASKHRTRRILGAMNRGRERAPLTAAAAVAGVVVGHALAYVAAYPAAGPREVLLGRTGHRYGSTAIAVAVVFGAAALAGTFVRHLIRGSRRCAAPTWWERYRGTALRLVALQASIFVVQESLERLGAGAPIAGLFHGMILPLGLAVQVLVAAALALVLAGLSRAAEAIGRALASPPVERRGRARFVLPAAPSLARAAAVGPRLTRAPPLLRAV
jgi:hypothetical protein